MMMRMRAFLALIALAALVCGAVLGAYASVIAATGGL